MRPLLVLAATLAFVLPAGAADAPRTEPLPDIPPPPEMADPDLEPQITISTRGEDKVEEYRLKGRLYMVKVTPRHGRAYYLVDQRGDGRLRRYDDLSPDFVVPMWMIKEF
jgi:hypothetical protein